MNNNRNSPYSAFSFDKMNGVSISSIGNHTKIEQSPDILKGIEPLPLMNNGRRDNTVIIKKNYKEGYKKKEVSSDIFQGTNSTSDINREAFYSTGLLNSLDDRHINRAKSNITKTDILKKPPPAKSLDGKPVTYLTRFKELTQAQLRAKNDNSQRFDAHGVNIESGQQSRGKGQNPSNIQLTKQTKQHREFTEKDRIIGNTQISGPIVVPKFQEATGLRSHEELYIGPSKSYENGTVYVNETIEDYNEYHPDTVIENNYVGPINSIRSYAENGITSISRLTTSLNHPGPVRFNKGITIKYDDIARGTDQIEETNYYGISNLLQKGQYIKSQDKARQTDREMEKEYITGPQNQNAGLVKKNIHERINQPYENYTPNIGPVRFNKGILPEIRETRTNDNSQETNYTGTVNSIKNGLIYKNNDQLRETYGSQEQEYITSPHNQDKGIVLTNEHQRLADIKENLVPNLGPCKENRGYIKEINETRIHDKSNETNYMGTYKDSKFTYTDMQDKPKETNIVLIKDYKGNTSKGGAGQSRNMYDNIQVNNYREDITKRDNRDLYGSKNLFGSGQDMIGDVRLNTLKESKGQFGIASANISNSPKITDYNIKSKNQLQGRLNINQHMTETLSGNPFINNRIY